MQTEQELNEYLAGRRVTGLRRRGKYLLVDFGAVDGPAGRPAAGRPGRATPTPARPWPSSTCA